MAVFGIEDTDPSDSESFRNAGYGFFVLILVMAVQPGVIEEIAFRGIIQGKLAKYIKPWHAILVSGITFAVIHLSPISVWLVFEGIYLAWLRHKSGSMYPSILAHFGHNFCVTLAEWNEWI